MNKSLEKCRAFYKGKLKCLPLSHDNFFEKISDSLTVSLDISMNSIIESLELNPEILPKTFKYGDNVCNVVGYVKSSTGIIIYFEYGDDIYHIFSAHDLIMEAVKGKIDIIFDED